MTSSSNLTSNDLLFRLQSKHLRYSVIAQNAEEVRDIQNSPSVSMELYLISSEQTHLWTTLSVYTLLDESREQVRLLYMNATALRIWKAMGKQVCLIGAEHRPPHTALLAFGVPFSESVSE
jgi:hypothetical protein